MRSRYLPLVLFGAACAASDAPEPAFVADFVKRSIPIHCVPVPELSARWSSVGDVATIDDSSFLVLYPREREVVVFGADLAMRRALRFTADGPAGVKGPASAALAGNTLLYVADQPRQALRVFDLGGRDRGTIRLRFPPQRVRAAQGALFLTPFVLGRHPRRLLYRLEGEEARPLEVPATFYGDPVLNALATTVGLTPFPDGRIVVSHEVVVPFLYELRVGSDAVRRAPLPLPDGVRSSVGRLPPAPLTPDRLDELLVASLAAAPDVRAGDFLYVTRSGRRVEGRPEKAIVRLDPELRYRRSYLLDVNAIQLAYLAVRGLSIVTDEVDQWYRCPTP